MQQVKDIMRSMDKTVHVDHPLTEAQVRMTKYGLDFIPAVDGDEIVGVLEKSDIFSKTTGATTHASNGDKVKDRLSGELVFCYDTDTVETAKGTMEKSGLDMLIVVDGDKRLTGLLTGKMIEEKLAKQKIHSDRTDARLSKRKANTAGRARGDRPGKPGNYSSEPFVNKNGK